MRFGIITVFILSFIISSLALQGLSFYLTKNQERTENRQNQIILEDIKFRFKLFLDIQSSIGIIGSEYFSKGPLEQNDYGPLNNERLLQINRQIMGFNVVDDQGKIVKVYPYEQNKKALGNESQNFEELKQSFKRGEMMWFSPPFKLFQGDNGFAIYYPITNSRKLKGWFATVISTQLFRKDFDVREFLSSYDLTILDNKTQRPYYSTAVLPEDNTHTFRTTGMFHGRELAFISWRKDPDSHVLFPFSWIMGGSFIFSLLMVLSFKFYDQRKRARLQLKDISMILKMTSKEAISRLIDLQQEIFKVGNLENAKYVTNLIEQVDLLQSTANEKREIEQECINILPVLLAEIEEADYLIRKKGIVLRFSPEKMTNLEIKTNPWLFKNNVMGSIITYAIIHAEQGSGISIECQKNFSRHILTFHTERAYPVTNEGQFINLDRRIEVARSILKISNATLKIDYDAAGGMLIRLEFP